MAKKLTDEWAYLFHSILKWFFGKKNQKISNVEQSFINKKLKMIQ